MSARTSALAFAVVACASAREPSVQVAEEASASEIEVVFDRSDADPVRVVAEVADTPSARRRGLMFRRHLPRNGGMLFVFERSAQRSFWMRNTYLSLDMIFIAADRRIVGVVEEATPHSLEPRAVEGESLYVLEVRGGFAREHGLVPTMPVRFVGLARE